MIFSNLLTGKTLEALPWYGCKCFLGFFFAAIQIIISHNHTTVMLVLFSGVFLLQFEKFGIFQLKSLFISCGLNIAGLVLQKYRIT